MSDLPREIRRIKHETRLRRLTVTHIQTLTPSMVRIALGGEDLAGFISPGFDDHIKLFFPDESGIVVLPTVSQGTPSLEQSQPLMRDFTPRRFDIATQQLYIDFALHDAGPATQWATQAKVGTPLTVGGPRGSTIIPLDYDWHLLIGDDTALPAIGRRLEELPVNSRALVVAEVPGEDHQLTFATAADVDFTWVHRRESEAGALEPLLNAVQSLQFPEGEYFAWAAAETSVVRSIRRHLIDTRGAMKEQLKTAGYWRHGAQGAHEPLQD